MEAPIKVTGVNVGPDGCFIDPFKFDVTFACHRVVPNNGSVRITVTYVGSAADDSCDQVLYNRRVTGAILPGTSKIIQLESKPPDADLVPDGEIDGVTVVFLSLFYCNREACRVGYYVKHTYNAATKRLDRCVLASKPRITEFHLAPK